MKKMIVFLMAQLLFGSSAVRATVPDVKRVVVVGVDAMGGYYLNQNKAKTPHIDTLRSQGAWTYLNMRNVAPGISLPNWFSMFGGASPSEHGVNSNEWKRTPAFTWPTVYGTLSKAIPNSKIGVFTQWYFYYSNVVDSGAAVIGTPASDNEAMQQAIAYFLKNRPDLLFVHLLDTDKKGHAYSWGSPQYYASIEHADSLIGNLVQAIEASGWAGETAIIISADHGGDISHEIGGGDPAMPMYSAVPFIIKGPKVRHTDLNFSTIGRELRIYDIAHTVLYLFGISEPSQWIGRPIVEAFDTAGLPPSTPKNLTARVVPNSRVDLSWTNTATNRTGFRIERKTVGGTYSTLDTVAANQTTYRDKKVAILTKYVYRVRAYNGLGGSGYSNEITADTGEFMRDDFSDGDKSGWGEVSQGKVYGPADWRETGGRLEQWSNSCDQSDLNRLFSDGRLGTTTGSG
jgi:hypothetical protein